MRPLDRIPCPRLADPDTLGWLERAGCADPGRGGAFWVASLADAAPMLALATASHGWDHVSCSRSDRCPTWDEMEQVRRLFFRPGETAMQLHVPPACHIDHHPYTLHLWRPQRRTIPRPPAWMVGPSGEAEADAAGLAQAAE